MLDLDKYIDHSIKVKLFGEEYDIHEPTMEMVMKITKIEEGITEENVNSRQLDVLELFLNYNVQGKIFKKTELTRLPLEAISRTIAEISAMRYEADKDPNLESQSHQEK